MVSSEDIKSRFYVIELPEVWRPLLAFGSDLPDCLKPPGVSEACVLTSRGLPMGFINSVSVAQSLYRSVVNQAVDRFGISRGQELRKDQPLPSTALAYRVYLDNYDALERTNADAAQLLEGQERPLTSELRGCWWLGLPVRRCLMSCLNEAWTFFSTFEGRLGVRKVIPEGVKKEIFACIALSPLAYMDLRAPYDPIVTAGGASESGGCLSFNTGSEFKPCPNRREGYTMRYRMITRCW